MPSPSVLFLKELENPIPHPLPLFGGGGLGGDGEAKEAAVAASNKLGGVVELQSDGNTKKKGRRGRSVGLVAMANEAERWCLWCC